MRHLTSRTATLAAAAALLLGCSDDGATDGIALDDPAGSVPEAIEDGTSDDDATSDAGAADTSDDDTSDDGPTGGSEGEVVDGTEAVPGTWQVGEAGTVTFDVVDGALVLEDVSEADGWTVTDVEEEADEVEVDLQRGDVEVEIEIELASGGTVLEVEIDTDIEDAEPGTYDLGDAGSLTFEVTDGRLELVDLTVTDGWEVTEQDVEGDEIEIELRDGAMRWDAGVDLNGSIEVELDYEVSGQL